MVNKGISQNTDSKNCSAHLQRWSVKKFPFTSVVSLQPPYDGGHRGKGPLVIGVSGYLPEKLDQGLQMPNNFWRNPGWEIMGL